MSADLVDLLTRCRAGDSSARDQLFSRYTTYLKILAHTQLGPRLRAKCDSSDIVQTTLLEAFRDFASFHGSTESELAAWLRRILAHNLFNEARRFNTQQRDAGRELSLDHIRAGLDHSSVALGRQVADAGPTPSQDADRREQAVLVAEALARLPDDYQQVLLLRVFDDLSAEQAAEIMGRSAGAVRMLQMRALAALRDEMQ